MPLHSVTNIELCKNKNAIGPREISISQPRKKQPASLMLSLEPLGYLSPLVSLSVCVHEGINRTTKTK